jgi:histidinol-phosphate phosphatase family protein
MSASNTKEQGCSVAILAGGLGTRLKSKTGAVPKSMVEVLGVPLLEHQILLCKKYGFKKICLLVHYGADSIVKYFGDGASFGVDIKYSYEERPKGTGGALRDALGMMDDVFIVLYGDTYISVDLIAMFKHHLEFLPAATIFLHPNDHPSDSDLIEVNAADEAIKVHPYPRSNSIVSRNLVNAALYVFDRRSVSLALQEDVKCDIAKNVFPKMLDLGFRLKAYVSPEYIKDLGTPDRLEKVEREIVCGLPRMLSTLGRRPAVFLDRDGTLNREVGHINSPNQLELLPGVSEAVKRLNKSGYMAIAITNQPVVARGEITIPKLDDVHAHLEVLLGVDGAYLDKIYYCPHHPDKGFPREVVEFKIKCDCRKPNTGMIDRAVATYGIDRCDSWMVGDTTSDIEAGKRAGLKTILVRSGYGGNDFKYSVTPDFVVVGLAHAVDWILCGYYRMRRQVMRIYRDIDAARLVLVEGLECSGKSFAAQVVRDVLKSSGKNAHLLRFDGGNSPMVKKVNDCNRDVGKSDYFCDKIVGHLSNKAETFFFDTLRMQVVTSEHSTDDTVTVLAEDVIVVEGLGVSQHEMLRKIADVRILVVADEEIRLRRVQDKLSRSNSRENLLGTQQSDKPNMTYGFDSGGQGFYYHRIDN